jgi:hypothetical protein
MAELKDNAYIISRLLKHPDNDFLRKQVDYEVPGLLFTPTCADPADDMELYYRVIRLANGPNPEQATAIIQQQIHAYARR